MEGLGLKFEYTSPGSPQQNGNFEHKFATLYCKVRSMLNGARLTPNFCHGLWTECAVCAKIEENILLIDKSPMPPYKTSSGVDAPLSNNLRTFGKIGIIANVQKKIKAKLDNHGSSCISVGYSTTHKIDVFRFYDTTTKHIHLIRDVTWLDKNYGTWKGLKTNIIKLEGDNFDDPGEFGRDDKNDEMFGINKMSNQLLLKKSLLFALHYVNLNHF